MQFVYSENAKRSMLNIEGEIYKYLFKVRRHKIDDLIEFRNLIDSNLYQYRVIQIDKREAILKLVNSIERDIKPQKYLEIGWCIIDTKVIEKTLPMLNEIGVSKISFIYCDLSQKKFKIDIGRLNKILINSNQQCGRTNLIEFELFKNLNEFLNARDEVTVLNFSNRYIEDKANIKTLLIGCEGGFSKNEMERFKSYDIVGFKTDSILRSESAVLSASAKILI